MSAGRYVLSMVLGRGSLGRPSSLPDQCREFGVSVPINGQGSGEYAVGRSETARSDTLPMLARRRSGGSRMPFRDYWITILVM